MFFFLSIVNEPTKWDSISRAENGARGARAEMACVVSMRYGSAFFYHFIHELATTHTILSALYSGVCVCVWRSTELYNTKCTVHI